MTGKLRSDAQAEAVNQVADIGCGDRVGIRRRLLGLLTGLKQSQRAHIAATALEAVGSLAKAFPVMAVEALMQLA